MYVVIAYAAVAYDHGFTLYVRAFLPPTVATGSARG
jgi:hypothetical protein